MRAQAILAATAALLGGGASSAQQAPLGSFIVCPGNPRCPDRSADPDTRGFSLSRDARRAQVGAVRSRSAGITRPRTTRVYFGSDSAALNPLMRAQLDGKVEALVGRQEEIWIEGHGDASGPQAHNVTLAARRAETVRDYLASRGVPRERMTLISWGSAQPANARWRADVRDYLSRRVEVRLANPADQLANPGSSR